MSENTLAYRLANTNEMALAARSLNVQVPYLAQVLVESGVISVPPRLTKLAAAKYMRTRANVIGPHDSVSRELIEIAEQLEGNHGC